MGQKVNPNSFRLQIRKDWSSVWYTSDNFYSKIIESDYLIRSTVFSHYKNLPIAKVLIERSDCDNASVSGNDSANSVQVAIYCGNSSVSSSAAIIGKQGKELESLKKKLTALLPNTTFKINAVEKRTDIDAMLIAKAVAVQIEKRGNYKKIAKKFIEQAIKYDDCLGIKLEISGRLGGAEIAKSETFKQGSIPLHKLKANIYYGFAEASTTYGVIGIKTWVYLV